MTDPSPPMPAGVDPNLIKDGPIIFISSKAKDTPLFMSVKMQLFGLHSHVRVIGNRTGFTADFDVTKGSDHVRSKVELLFKEGIRVAGSISLTIGTLNLPSINFTGKNLNVGLPGKTLTSLRVSLSFNFSASWPGNVLAIYASFTPSVIVFDRSFVVATITISASVQIEDIETIGKIAGKVANQFVQEWKRIISELIKKLPIGEAIRLLRKQFDMGVSALTKIISIVVDQFNLLSALNEVRKAIGVGTGELAKVARELGIGWRDAMRVLGLGRIRVVSVSTSSFVLPSVDSLPESLVINAVENGLFAGIGLRASGTSSILAAGITHVQTLTKDDVNVAGLDDKLELVAVLGSAVVSATAATDIKIGLTRKIRATPDAYRSDSDIQWIVDSDNRYGTPFLGTVSLSWEDSVEIIGAMREAELTPMEILTIAGEYFDGSPLTTIRDCFAASFGR